MLRPLPKEALVQQLRRHRPGRHIWSGSMTWHVSRLRKRMRNFRRCHRTQAVGAELGWQAVVHRFKGLGEMMPAQLWATTMNAQSRVLKRVGIEDGEAADAVFKLLMGEQVEHRRRWIEELGEWVG